jgi:hypothetical protein
MKFKSQVYTAVSGSIGGITYAHNAGGMYARGRATPTDPNTARQQNVRGYMSDLNVRWNNTLTQTQRDEWALYAANVTLLNAFGDPINVSGIAMYQRSNVLRLQFGLDPVDDGPPVFNLGTQAPPAFTGADEGDQMFNFDYPGSEPSWVSEDGSALVIFTGRPQNAGVTFYKGPFRSAVAILGDSTTPPTFPVEAPATYPITAGQRAFARVRLLRADGRVSPAQIVNGIVA